MTEVSQYSFLDSFHNYLCDTEVCSDVLIFDVIPSQDSKDEGSVADSPFQKLSTNYQPNLTICRCAI